MKKIMKKSGSALLVSIILSFQALAQSTAVVDSFKVNGNCEMCKERIEKAAKAQGVVSAEWNMDSHWLVINYDSSVVSLDSIQKKIAEVGHDTPSYRATDAAYAGLHKCCKYERVPLAEKAGSPVKTVKYKITGMTCEEGCAKGIQNALYKRKGVKSSEVNFVTGIATIVYDERKVTREELRKIIESYNGDGGTLFYKAEEIN